MRVATTVLILLVWSTLHAEEPKSPQLTPEEMKLADEAKTLQKEGILLYQRGKLAEASVIMKQVLKIRRQLYPSIKWPNGHPDLAGSLSNVGAALQAMGSYEESAAVQIEALAMREKLYPQTNYPTGHPELAASLANLGNVYVSMRAYEKGVQFHERAVAMIRLNVPKSKYPHGTPLLAEGLNNLGSAYSSMGLHDRALDHHEQALVMYQNLFSRTKFPEGHPLLAGCLYSLSQDLVNLGSYDKALVFAEQALAIREKLYPPEQYADGHPDLMQSLDGLGILHHLMGSPDKGLVYHERAVAMSRKRYPITKYPNGHPLLAHHIYNLASALSSIGLLEKAVEQFKSALAMATRYSNEEDPQAQILVARILVGLGGTLLMFEAYEEALQHFQNALAISRKLDPATHYQNGTERISVNLHNLGFTHILMGQEAKALPYYEQSLRMRQQLTQRDLQITSEAVAFERIAAEPLARDSYLSLTRRLNMPARANYEAIWPSLSMVTRILEQRHANARMSPMTSEKSIQLKANRRRTEQLLQMTAMKSEDRDRLLLALADERDKLERELIAKMPVLKQWNERRALGPNELVDSLPDGALFLDFIRYIRFEYPRNEQGKLIEKKIPSYVVFILAKGQPIRRVELNDADSIDDAIAVWRAAVDRGQDTRGLVRDDDPPAIRSVAVARDTIRRRIWEPLVKQLPAKTTTLYLSLDGDLTRLPWAALPVSDHRVLLEDFALATVPHGSFLLEQVRYRRTYAAAKSTLLLGGVDYHSNVWPNLPGTALELKTISTLVTSEREILHQDDATSKRLVELLPKVHFAHFATHGYFDSEKIVAERKRSMQAMKSRQFGDDSRRVAANNPLGYVGLVLSNSEIMSGLSIVDLPLDNLQLVTLSACETGLGELTGGEGVQGLQRAFHLAGCPNVVASLWKVNDAATAALMAKFYHELWINKKPPIEALREAQLMIYRRPDLIPDLTGERGAPNLKRAIDVKSVDPIPKEVKGMKTADTKLWAAFVLSGVGR